MTPQERIKADAEKKYSRITALAIANRIGYIAGATAEQQIANSEMNDFLKWFFGESANQVKRDWEQWKSGKGKEVGDES